MLEFIKLEQLRLGGFGIWKTLSTAGSCSAVGPCGVHTTWHLLQTGHGACTTRVHRGLRRKRLAMPLRSQGCKESLANVQVARTARGSGGSFASHSRTCVPPGERLPLIADHPSLYLQSNFLPNRACLRFKCFANNAAEAKNNQCNGLNIGSLRSGARSKV